jgi:hypothetical protein
VDVLMRVDAPVDDPFPIGHARSCPSISNPVWLGAPPGRWQSDRTVRAQWRSSRSGHGHQPRRRAAGARTTRIDGSIARHPRGQSSGEPDPRDPCPNAFSS